MPLGLRAYGSVASSAKRRLVYALRSFRNSVESAGKSTPTYDIEGRSANVVGLSLKISVNWT